MSTKRAPTHKGGERRKTRSQRPLRAIQALPPGGVTARAFLSFSLPRLRGRVREGARSPFGASPRLSPSSQAWLSPVPRFMAAPTDHSVRHPGSQLLADLRRGRPGEFPNRPHAVCETAPGHRSRSTFRIASGKRPWMSEMESSSSVHRLDSRNFGGEPHLFDLTRVFFRCLFDSRRGNCGIAAMIRVFPLTCGERRRFRSATAKSFDPNRHPESTTKRLSNDAPRCLGTDEQGHSFTASVAGAGGVRLRSRAALLFAPRRTQTLQSLQSERRRPAQSRHLAQSWMPAIQRPMNPIGCVFRPAASRLWYLALALILGLAQPREMASWRHSS
jgi:hypothetical protein